MQEPQRQPPRHLTACVLTYTFPVISYRTFADALCASLLIYPKATLY